VNPILGLWLALAFNAILAVTNVMGGNAILSFVNGVAVGICAGALLIDHVARR
jgi:hypothetical protein